MTMYAAIARSSRAMRSAQIAYDNAEPDTREPWIETREGDGWLEAGIAELLAKRDVKLVGKVIVSAKRFIVEFSQAAADVYAADDEFDLEWDLATGRPYYAKKYQELAREVAVRLLLPHAAEAEFEADMEMF